MSTRCPSEEVLILYASLEPDSAPDDPEELLDSWTPEAVEAHLATCDDCRAQVDRTEQLTAQLREDELDEPAGAFWDDMAEEVMRSIEVPPEAAGGAPPNVLEMPPDRRQAVADQRARNRSVTRWAWAIAAAAALMLAVGATYLDLGGKDDGGPHGYGALADDLVPDADTAEALALELGLSTEPLDAEAAAIDEFAALDAAFEEAGKSSLERILAETDVDAVELALVDPDPYTELFELDADELASLLAALEG